MACNNKILGLLLMDIATEISIDSTLTTVVEEKYFCIREIDDTQEKHAIAIVNQ